MSVKDIDSDVHSRWWEIKRVQDLLKNPDFLGRYKENHPEINTHKEMVEALLQEPIKMAEWRVHRHEWVTLALINKYVDWHKYFPKDLSEYVNRSPITIKIDTKEVHNCNLIELTPELYKKAFWWHRWGRSTYSHLLEREDFVWEDGKPLENKTSTLTVVATVDPNLDHYWDPEGEPFISIITAFWWDWSAENEIRRYYNFDESDENRYHMDCLEYRLNHALIVEENDRISVDFPSNVEDYINKKKLDSFLSYLNETEISTEFKEFCLKHLEDENNVFRALYYGSQEHYYDRYEDFNEEIKKEILKYLEETRQEEVRQTGKWDN